MPSTIAARLADHFCTYGARNFSHDSIAGAKRLVLDYLGVAIAGSQTESGRIATRYIESSGGKAEASLIGGRAKAPVAQAAFANAISSHSLELDDVDVLALFHFSPPILSSALAMAERQKVSGKQFLIAIIAGCEMMERLSNASNNSLRNRGFHTTPTCGVFGATVAAGILLHLSPKKLSSAFGLAGAQACGLMEMYGPSMQKRFNPGPAARNGVTATTMADIGFTGAETIFEGERGFLRAFTDKSDPLQLTNGLGRAYRLQIEFKPYSCARPIHNAIDCALKIRKSHPLKLPAIRTIEVERHPEWAHYHQNTRPKTYHEAQVSLPYSVAIALKEGRALLKQYSNENLRDPLLRKIAGVTRIVVNPALSRGVSCKMTITLTDGEKHVAQVDYPKGSIRNPMSTQDLSEKFHNLATPVIGAARARKLENLVSNIERCKDIAKLMRLTQKLT